jgi:hypothetical protein
MDKAQFPKTISQVLIKIDIKSLRELWISCVYALYSSFSSSKSLEIDRSGDPIKLIISNLDLHP